MPTRPLLLLAALGLVGGVALVQRARTPDLFSEASLTRLLQQPARRTGAPAEDAPRPLWRALLEPPLAERGAAGTTLRLGRVLALPTAAHGSAASAGELLALEAEGPAGALGLPLWRVVLDGPAVERGARRTLKLYGCRHSADADAGPAIEDTYVARLALAEALRRHAAADAGAAPLELVGQDVPARGGVNFEVQLMGETQAIEVTFDGHDGPRYRARRTHRPAAPSDARARAHLVAALRALAAGDASLGALTIEGEPSPAAGGVDVRFDVFDGRLCLTAVRGASRLSAHLPPPAAPGPEQPSSRAPVQ